MRTDVFVALWLIAIGMAGGATDGASAFTPASGRGTTDPAFDWETPPAKPSPDRYALGTFKSTRTFAETTRWLKDALERYGKTKPTVYEEEIKDVRFAGCTMEWTQRSELGLGISRVSSHSVPLREVDLAVHAVQVFSEEMRFRTKREFPVVERILEKDRQKSMENRKESSAQWRLRKDELIPHRVSWALVHLAKLCGAEVPTPR
jgi:hypothetical protein